MRVRIIHSLLLLITFEFSVQESFAADTRIFGTANHSELIGGAFIKNPVSQRNAEKIAMKTARHVQPLLALRAVHLHPVVYVDGVSGVIRRKTISLPIRPTQIEK